MAKKLLILGAGLDQVPGIVKAKEMGIYTIVLDGNLTSEGFKFADEFHIVSIKHIEQIETFLNAYKSKIDGVIAFGVDIPYIISYVANKLNINYNIPLESARISEDKFLSKEFMKKNKINIPSYKLVNSETEINSFAREYGYPIILKPVDNSASRGINFITSFDEVKESIDYALDNTSKNGLILEKFLAGPQISTESFIVNSKVYNIGFADRNYEEMERFLPNIIENGGDLPSLYMKDKHKKVLTKYLEIIANKLNIKNGIIKGDIVIHNDELYIIEFALRLSGGNFSTIEIPESTGVDFLKIAIKLHMNLEIEENELLIKKNDFISLRYKFLEDIKLGLIKSINIPKNEDYISTTLFVNPGDEIKFGKTQNHANRIASIIIKGSTRQEAINKADRYLEDLEIVIE